MGRKEKSAVLLYLRNKCPVAETSHCINKHERRKGRTTNDLKPKEKLSGGELRAAEKCALTEDQHQQLIEVYSRINRKPMEGGRTI